MNNNNNNNNEWRLIIDETKRSASENMAIDYALLKNCSFPVLRFYSWRPKAVSIGRFQSLKDNINLDICSKNSIDFVRRITGGGTVFHSNEITYSVCIPEKNDYFSDDLHESYQVLCKCIIEALEYMGLDASYEPINDIVISGKKISGCAQTRKFGNILQHGTILLKIDVNEMFSLIKVSDEKMKDKIISNVKKRVTSLELELDNKVIESEVRTNVINAFKNILNIEFIKSSLSNKELEDKKNIQKEVFDNDEWTYER